MSDDICVNVFNELDSVAGSLSSGIFSGNNLSGQLNLWTGFSILIVLTLAFLTFFQYFQRSR